MGKLIPHEPESLDPRPEKQGRRPAAAGAKGRIPEDQSFSEATSAAPAPEPREDRIHPAPFLSTAREPSAQNGDEVRQYLTQMGAIPRLSREDELRVAKRIALARKRWRTTLFESVAVLATIVEHLEQVAAGRVSWNRIFGTSLGGGLDRER